MKIEKLIEQYQERIKNCDTMLNVFKKNIREARHNNTDSAYDREERKHFSAQRQCYIQIISDLEDLE